MRKAPYSLLRNNLVLRNAEISDADVLLNWRNNLQTRKASRNEKIILRSEHIKWLQNVLCDPSRLLLIAEYNGKAVGTVRLDRTNNYAEISWTIAPDARGRGFGKEIVKAVAQKHKGPLCAHIRSGNAASARIAMHAGMKLDREENGYMHFYKGEAL